MSKPSFHWEDPLLLQDQLSTEERMIADAAREYAQGKLAPRVQEAFRAESTDPSIFREMGELGLLGITIPEQYGGANLNYVSYGLIAREIERVDSGYRSMMSVQSSLVMVPNFQILMVLVIWNKRWTKETQPQTRWYFQMPKRLC